MSTGKKQSTVALPQRAKQLPGLTQRTDVSLGGSALVSADSFHDTGAHLGPLAGHAPLRATSVTCGTSPCLHLIHFWPKGPMFILKKVHFLKFFLDPGIPPSETI